MNTTRNRKVTSQVKTELLAVGVGLVVLLSILGLYYQIQQFKLSQSTTSRATSQITKLVWGNFTNQAKTNETIAVPLVFNTQQYAISGLQVSGVVTNVTSDKVNISTYALSGLIPAITKISQDNNSTKFTLVYFSDISKLSLFSTQGTDQKIADIAISNLPEGSYSMQITNSASGVTSYQYPGLSISTPGVISFAFIAPTNTNSGNVDIKKDCDQNCATDTECKSEFICYEGRCRSNKDKKDPKCAVVPDQGIHRSCNEYCADNKECKSELTCYYNKCRHPLNLQSENCTLSTPTPKSKTTSKGQTTRTVPSPKPSPKVVAKITIDADKSASKAAISSPKPTPSPSLRPTPSPSPSLKPSPSPSPVVQAPEEEKTGGNWLKILAGVMLLGLVGAGAYVALVMWKPKGSNL